MKRTVVIIAHNEEALIGKCLDSVFEQTIKPDQVIVVAHRCTDKTAEVARQYPVEVHELLEGGNNSFARVFGFTHVFGDLVFCLDGDAVAEPNWIEELERKLLEKPTHVLAGTFVHIRGTLFWSLFSWFDKWACVIDPNKAAWIWGASFAFKKENISDMQRYVTESSEVSTKLGLQRSVNDFWFALQMQNHGTLGVTNKTCVHALAKEKTTKESLLRNRSDIRGGKKLYAYWKELQARTS